MKKFHNGQTITWYVVILEQLALNNGLACSAFRLSSMGMSTGQTLRSWSEKNIDCSSAQKFNYTVA